jgi:HTH-type transcriptional regulator, competence development regulator
MKLHITKAWFHSRAHLEEGLEIGAGSLHHIGKPALRVLPAADSEASVITQRLSFGRFIALMRRKRRWTIRELAKRTEATDEELLAIENEHQYVPELSTVFGLAKTFSVPAANLIKMSGLAETPLTLREGSIRFAACSESKEPLSEDEDAALQAILKVLVEDTSKK